MAIIYALTRGMLVRYAAAFILGLILGSLCSMLLAAHQIDRVIIENETLRSELSERDTRIVRLEESLRTQRRHVVRAIEISLETNDQHLSLRLKDHIRSLIDGLIGREIDTIDPMLIAAIFDQRVIAVDNERFLLKLNLLAISDTLRLYLTATPAPNDDVY